MNFLQSDDYPELLTGGYSKFFQKIFGGDVHPPFEYQKRLAENFEDISLLNIPTGAGKTKAILGAWVWRRLTRPAGIGRRLIYCLPMRTLVDQTYTVACEAIKSLHREYPAIFKKDNERFKPSLLLGGKIDDEWEQYPELEQILIGTQDMLISRALNRGYGMSRFKWPVHFGLLNNDALWIYDEVQLMNDGLATTIQLDAFRRKFGTFGNTQSIWMSATLDRDWLKHIDSSSYIEDLTQLELSEHDLSSAILNRRFSANKNLQPAPIECRHPEGLANFIKSIHQSGTQTLIVVNTVQRAREVYDQLALKYGMASSILRKNPQKDSTHPLGEVPELQLIHSRFRATEREKWKTLLNQKPDPEGQGRIVVATQVIEAGVDISSRLLITDIAPFSSLVQRFGRCNRNGEYERADIFWIDRPLTEKTAKFDDKTTLDDAEWEKIASPYQKEQINEATLIIDQLESASLARLSSITYQSPYRPNHLLRARDLIDLFDTTPDLTGYDIDISRFVRGGDDNDLDVTWRKLNKEKPDRSTPAPTRNEICTVPVYELRDFLKGKDGMAWIWDALDGDWRKVKREYIFPGMTIILDTSCGGYDTIRGWDPKNNNPVTDLEVSSGNNESYNDDLLTWVKYDQTLSAHSLEARQAAARIIDSIAIHDLEEYRSAILEATQHHDWGKAHPVFQATLHGITAETPLDEFELSPVLAKSTSGGRHRRKRFRHELASALALLQTGADDLVIYLAACHHGKVRLSIRALPDETRPDNRDLRYARGIWDLDPLPATDLGDNLIKPGVTLNLEPMVMGSDDGATPSWLERMIGLRNKLGVFRLAYLEGLIRAADVQASRYPLNILDEVAGKGDSK